MRLSTERILNSAPFAGLLAFALAGCINDSHDHEHDEQPWEHACQHAAKDPTSVTANSDKALAPDVGEDHTHFGISFTSGSMVKFTADGHGEFAFLLTKNVPVTLTDEAGETVPIEETETELTGCPDLAVMHIADLEEGLHFLTFGTSAESRVGLIIEETTHHDP